jgi:hypothetical protein
MRCSDISRTFCGARCGAGARSRTTIAGSLSGCIDGSRQFSRRWWSFVLRRWCTGIGPAFAVIAAISPARGDGGRKSRRNSAY